MKNKEPKTRQSSNRAKLEAEVLDAYNLRRRQNDQESPTEAYTAVGKPFRLYYYQVQYIILKAKKAGKKVL
jgi:hypothetical protein